MLEGLHYAKSPRQLISFRLARRPGAVFRVGACSRTFYEVFCGMCSLSGVDVIIIGTFGPHFTQSRLMAALVVFSRFTTRLLLFPVICGKISINQDDWMP